MGRNFKKIRNKLLALGLSISMLPVSGLVAWANDGVQVSDQPKQVELPDTGDTLEKKFLVPSVPFFNLKDKKYHKDQVVNIRTINSYLNIRTMFGDPESAVIFNELGDYKLLQDEYIIDFSDKNMDEINYRCPNLAALGLDNPSLAYRLFSGSLDDRMFMNKEQDENGNFTMKKEDSHNSKEVYGENRVETFNFLSDDESNNVAYSDIKVGKKIPD